MKTRQNRLPLAIRPSCRNCGCGNEYCRHEEYDPCETWTPNPCWFAKKRDAAVRKLAKEVVNGRR